NVNVGTLAGYVEGEHPQTIAMILAHMPSEISSEILMTLPDEQKGDIALRIAKLGQISEDVVRDVDKALKMELSGAVGPGGKAGGLEVLVDIINGVDKSTEDAVMEFVEEDDAEMANDIRNLMFVFEDLTNIDDTAMREILKKVEGQQLTYALKTATEEMKEKIFSNLSQRAGEMLKDDLEAMGPVRLTEVEEAQQAVIRAAKELEADGTITLGKGKDDVLV
ncbi:MAG: flagellar motor switch protein FliG, partial [Desulfobacteraceae bacterium]|nr:flagellar motor switch protein FliG [Desulfobacteraceae bacterium]